MSEGCGEQPVMWKMGNKIKNTPCIQKCHLLEGEEKKTHKKLMELDGKF